MNERELGRQLRRAFAPMPPDFGYCIELGFERGEKAGKKRHSIMTLLSVTAVICAVFAVGVLAVNGISGPQPDNAVLSAPEEADAVQLASAHDMVNPAAEDNAAVDSALMPDEGDVHFYDGDFADSEALYILLNNAYWTHVRENNLKADSRVVYDTANELKNIYFEHEDSSDLNQLIRECLKNEMGLSKHFISAHYMINDTLACLSQWFHQQTGMFQHADGFKLQADAENMAIGE